MVVVGLPVESSVDAERAEVLAVRLSAVQGLGPCLHYLHLREALRGVLASLHDPVPGGGRIIERGDVLRGYCLRDLVTHDERGGEKKR